MLPGQRPAPNAEQRLSHDPHIPLGGSGRSGGHVAHHGVIHVSHRPRRTERKDICITLMISDMTRGNKESVIRAKAPTITPDRQSGTHGEWGRKSIRPA